MVESLEDIFSHWHYMNPRIHDEHDGFYLRHYSGEIVNHTEIAYIIENLLDFYGHISPSDLSVFGEKTGEQERESESSRRATYEEDKKSKRLERRSSKGYIYLLSSGMGQYKIGKASCLDKRVKTLGIQIPFNLELAHSIPVNDMDQAETYLHDRLAHCRLKGEWFALKSDEVDWIKSIQDLDDLAKETA